MSCDWIFLIDWVGIVFITVLAASFLLTCLGRGIQIRAIPLMIKLLVLGPRITKQQNGSTLVIDPRKALLTAMSTTIGIGNIFGPIVAIGFAGPGALVAYLLATVLGAASTYTEVFFALKFRRRYCDGQIQAGPMAYMQHVLPSSFASLYAFAGSVLLAAWSMSQSHTVAHMVQNYGIPCEATGIFLAFIVTYAVFNGIRWIASLNSTLVPIMFILYVGSGLVIIGKHIGDFPRVCEMILEGFWQPRSIIAGVAVYSFFDVLRWGLARALQSNEAGIGTSTIPHSLSESDSPTQQAVLAMASVYSNGIICLMSGLIYLMSGAYENSPGCFDASLINGIFRDHFSYMGEPLILVITFLFALGTILGNVFNGTRCFAFLTKNRWTKAYALVAGLCVAIGSTLDLKVVWAYIDYLMVPVALPHTLALILLAIRYRSIYNLNNDQTHH